MIAAVFAYAVAMTLMANIGEIDSLWLKVVDWILTVLFVISGSINGWQSSRK